MACMKRGRTQLTVAASLVVAALGASCVDQWDGASGHTAITGAVSTLEGSDEQTPSDPLDALIAKQVKPKHSVSSTAPIVPLSQPNSTWYPAPTLGATAVDVALSDSGKVYVVTSAGTIHWIRYYGGNSYGSWQNMSGWATRISSGKSRPWVVGGSGAIYEWTGTNWVNRSFPYTGVDIAVGDESLNYVWAKDNLGRLWKYSGSSAWSLVTSGVTGGIDASRNGTIWVVAGPYRYVYYKTTASSWVYANANSMIDIAAANTPSTVPWAVSNTGIYSWTGSGSWTAEVLPIYPDGVLSRGTAIDNSWCHNYAMQLPAVVGEDGGVYIIDIPLGM